MYKVGNIYFIAAVAVIGRSLPCCVPHCGNNVSRCFCGCGYLLSGLGLRHGYMKASR